MRMLHVSDWHVGKPLGRVSRRVDHEAVLDEIAGVTADFRPDVIVHTGDLFEKRRPDFDDVRFAMDALGRLGGHAPVIVLAGNHDSPILFDLLTAIVDPARRVRFISRARTAAEGGIVDLPAAGGAQRLRVAPLPYVHPNRMIEPGSDSSRWAGQYRDHIAHVEAVLGDGLLDGFDVTRDVLIFAAHLHVAGANLAGSELRAAVKAEYETAVDHLPAVSYAAFGHIHAPQMLADSNRVGRYAGSPMQLDFGELGDTKSVVAVEADPGRAAIQHVITLSAGRPLLRLSGTLDELAGRASTIGPSLLAVTVHTDTHTPGIDETIADVFTGSTIVNFEERCADRVVAPLSAQTGPAERQPGFDELFGEFLAERGRVGRSRPERVRSAFDQLLAATEADEDAAFPEAERLLDIASDDLEPTGPAPAGEAVRA